jgi:hypothetical protein
MSCPLYTQAVKQAFAKSFSGWMADGQLYIFRISIEGIAIDLHFEFSIGISLQMYSLGSKKLDDFTVNLRKDEILMKNRRLTFQLTTSYIYITALASATAKFYSFPTNTKLCKKAQNDDIQAPKNAC